MDSKSRTVDIHINLAMCETCVVYWISFQTHALESLKQNIEIMATNLKQRFVCMRVSDLA